MKTKIFLITILILIVDACKQVRIIKPESIHAIPLTYSNNSDSLNSSEMIYSSFLKDSNLIQLVDTALKNNRDLMIAFQRIHYSQSDFLLQKGLMKPFVGANLNVSQRKFGLYTMDGAGNITTPIYNGRIVPEHLLDYNIGFQTAWEIDVWGKLKNRKISAYSKLLASYEGKNLVVSNLICEVSNNYYELMAYEYALKIVDENLQLQESTIDFIKEQKLAGKTNELAVQQFEAQFYNSKSLRQDIVQNIIETENTIKVLSGKYDLKVLRDSEKFLSLTIDSLNIGIPSDLLRNRPDIRQAEMELLATNADLKAARAAFYPSFNITGTMGFQAFRTDLLFISPESFAYGLLGNLVAPLINKSAIKANFNSTSATQLEAMYNYQKSVLNAYIEVYNLMSQMRNLDIQYQFKKSEMEILTNAIETSNELYKAGKISYLEVLFAQQSLLQSKLDLIEIKKNQFFSMSNLYKALGGGWK